MDLDSYGLGQRRGILIAMLSVRRKATGIDRAIVDTAAAQLVK